MTIHDIFSLASPVFLAIYAVTSIFNGTRRLVTGDRPKGAAIMLILGVLVCLAYSGVNFIQYRTVSSMMDSQEKAKIKVPPESEWSKDLTPEHREAIWEMDAKLKFVESGKLVTYPDKDGKKKTYTPTQDEIRSREEMSLKTAQLKQLVYDRHIDGFKGVLAGMFAALLGLSAGRRSRAIRPT
jgi:hypothetical protein